jgi:hypothetical protein
MPYSVDRQPNENEFECANCGAIVLADLTRCPECGVNLYEPGDEAEDESPPDSGSPNARGPLAQVIDLFKRLLGLSHPAEELFAAPRQQAQLYASLLRKAGGDRAAADRLIDLERRRLPKADRLTWLENAIRKWERDNN